MKGPGDGKTGFLSAPIPACWWNKCSSWSDLSTCLISLFYSCAIAGFRAFPCSPQKLHSPGEWCIHTLFGNINKTAYIKVAVLKFHIKVSEFFVNNQFLLTVSSLNNTVIPILLWHAAEWAFQCREEPSKNKHNQMQMLYAKS